MMEKALSHCVTGLPLKKVMHEESNHSTKTMSLPTINYLSHAVGVVSSAILSKSISFVSGPLSMNATLQSFWQIAVNLSVKKLS